MPKLGEHPTKETLAKMRQAARIRHGIKDPPMPGRNKSPLRKVVSFEPDARWRHTIATLECGHFKTYVGPIPKRAPRRVRCDACWQPVVETDENLVNAIYAEMLGCSEESAEDRIKYERDMLLMLILDGDEFGKGAFDRAVEKLKRALDTLKG